MRLLALACCFVGFTAVAETKTTVTITMPDCPGDNAVSVDVYTPNGTPPFPTVALGHGYQNGKENFAVLAAQLCSEGFLVVVPQFPCCPPVARLISRAMGRSCSPPSTPRPRWVRST